MEGRRHRISSHSRTVFRSRSGLMVIQPNVITVQLASRDLLRGSSSHLYFCRRKKTVRFVLAMVALEPFVVATAIQLVLDKFVLCRTVKGPAPPPAQVSVMPGTPLEMPMKVGETAAMLP